MWLFIFRCLLLFVVFVVLYCCCVSYVRVVARCCRLGGGVGVC